MPKGSFWWGRWTAVGEMAVGNPKLLPGVMGDLGLLRGIGWKIGPCKSVRCLLSSQVLNHDVP